MKQQLKSAHQRAIIRRISKELFEELIDALAAKIGFYPMTLDECATNEHGTIYTKQALLEDPTDEQAFSVNPRFTAVPYEDGVRFTLEVFVLSRQVRRFGRLPTAEEAYQMSDDDASDYLFFTRCTTKMEVVRKGRIAKNIKADLAKALQKDGAFDKAIEWARVVTKYNIKTSKALWKMQRSGWQVHERNIRTYDALDTTVTGGKVFFKFGHLLTPNQVIAIQEAMTPVLEDIGISPEQAKVLFYDPHIYRQNGRPDIVRSRVEQEMAS